VLEGSAETALGMYSDELGVGCPEVPRVGCSEVLGVLRVGD